MFLGGSSFYVLTDHRPLTFSFKHNHTDHTCREIRQFAYTTEIATDIQKIEGDHITAAHALSRTAFVVTATADDDLITIPKAQLHNVHLMDLGRSTTGLELQAIRIDS